MLLQNRVKEEVSKPFNQTSKDLLFSLHKEVFGSLNGLSLGCSSCKHDAYTILKHWLKNQDVFKAKINLFTSYYKDTNEKRQTELDFCLNYNRNSMIFDNVIVVEDKRPTFKDLFELTKQYPNDINVITNSDIFFTESIFQCKLLQPNQCFALSRWDYQQGGTIKHFDAKDAQDTWVFNGVANVNGGDFFMGIPGCDNRIAYEIKNSGYNISNPSKSIKSVHLHLSEVRNYNRNIHKVEQPYLMLPPCTM